MPAKQAVAVIGNGVMGGAIATRLLSVGHAVHVYDVDAAKADALVGKGAVKLPGPAAAFKSVDFAITSLNSAAVVRSVVFGPGGLAESAGPGKMLIDMSSIDPASTREMAAELKDKFAADWVDAPLSGGAPKALVGKLAVMAGGTADDVLRARAIMDSLCANYSHMGPVGAGQTTKLVNQVLCALGFQAVAEAVRLAEAGGVDAARIPAALAGGRADSSILQEYGAKMAGRDYSPTGRIDNMLKDLEAVQTFAMPARIALPLTSVVTDLQRMFVAAGLGPADNAATMQFFDGKK